MEGILLTPLNEAEVSMKVQTKDSIIKVLTSIPHEHGYKNP